MRENARVTERPSFLGDAPVNDETAELFAAAGLRLMRVVPTAGPAFVLEGGAASGR